VGPGGKLLLWGGRIHCDWRAGQHGIFWSAAPINAFTLWQPENVRITRGEENIGTFSNSRKATVSLALGTGNLTERFAAKAYCVLTRQCQLQLFAPVACGTARRRDVPPRANLSPQYEGV
jgi:hypothetical protein